MNLDDFKATLEQDSPPQGLGKTLAALWHDAKGEWDKAHKLAQDQRDEAGAWVHAYLHRVEGDESNAGYWYRRAGKSHCTLPLEQEWAEIAEALLREQS